jgi:hypothetical protein
MTSEIAAVEATAWAYLDALYDGDADRLGKLFLPESGLFTGTADGQAAVVPRDAWLDRVRGRQSARDARHANTNAVFAIEVIGTVAMARVTASHPPNRFDDLLSLVKTSGGWKIAAKTYTVSPL